VYNKRKKGGTTMSENERKIFARNLRRYMALKDKKQIDLMNDLGLSSSTVSSWVNGIKMPRMDKVQMLADYLGIRKSDLIEDITYYDSVNDNKQTYYLDEETAKYAQMIASDPDLKMLFDATRKIKKEDMQLVYEMVKRFKSDAEEK
jgi:transcriptional regulator with XRE-family HTH domain